MSFLDAETSSLETAMPGLEDPDRNLSLEASIEFLQILLFVVVRPSDTFGIECDEFTIVPTVPLVVQGI